MRSERRSDEEIARMLEIRSQLPDDLDSLAAKLSDPDHLVRMQAIMKMMRLDDPAAVEFLRKAMEDEHAEVRASAALSLGHYKDLQALPAILDHLTHDSSPGVRVMCVFAAESIGSDAAMEGLKAALDDPDEHVRYGAAFAFPTCADSRAVDKIRELLHDPASSLRSGSAMSLIRLGIVDDQVMNVLVGDPSWEARREVAQELINAKVADRRIVDAVEHLMHEPEAEEYEAQIAAQRAFMESDEYKAINEQYCDSDEELSEEDQEMLRELEESMDKPLAELLARARKLLEER